MIKDSIDYLIKIATNSPYSDNLLEARKEYQGFIGDIFEDDKSYENQMALFLEWFIFERIDSAHKQTILESIINNNNEIPPHILKFIDLYKSNIHGLFLIKKIKKDYVRVVNLFEDESYDAIELSGDLYFSKNSIFEGRLLPHENSYCFTGNFCFHPEESKKFIKREINKITLTHKINEKKLKVKISKLNCETKKLKKAIKIIDKIKKDIQSSKSDKKISKYNDLLTDLVVNKSKYEKNCTLLSDEILNFKNEIIIKERKQKQTSLMLRLTSKRLLLERSRKIEIKDIYKD